MMMCIKHILRIDQAMLRVRKFELEILTVASAISLVRVSNFLVSLGEALKK